MPRYPSKTSVLRFLKEAGVEFGTILDVGAHEETRELRLAFPNKRHILFEPADEFASALKRNYAAIDHLIVPVAVSDQDGEGFLKKFSIDGNAISHSTLIDPAVQSYSGVVSTLRLDTFMSKRNEPKPYLLKIDVDGFEIPIMKGCDDIWHDISCVMIEATAATFAERFNFLTSKGFVLFDIVDQCYYYNMMSQVDLVMVSKEMMLNPNFRPWETKEFSWDKWEPIARFEQTLNDSKRVSSKATGANAEPPKLVNHAQSLEEARSELERTPTDPMAMTVLANLLISARQLDEAKELLLKATTGDPANAYAHQQLSYLYCIRGDMTSALHLAERAVDLAPNVKEFTLHLDQVRFQTKRHCN